jgi:hypothetical protein
MFIKKLGLRHVKRTAAVKLLAVTVGTGSTLRFALLKVVTQAAGVRGSLLVFSCCTCTHIRLKSRLVNR